MNHRSVRRLLGAVLLPILPLVAGAGLSRPLHAQSDPPVVEAAPVPYGPGEKAVYQVKLGVITVGHGSMSVLGVEYVQGHPTYHARLEAKGGIPLARVDDRFESWIDVHGLFSRRFRQDQKEVHYERHRRFDFFPESLSFRQVDNGKTGTLPTNRPLDDVSFLYYVRTLPLRVGDTYTIPRYFQESGNPVVLKVLRKETVTVPAGTFNTVVVQPVIRSSGLFGEGGRAEVYFTDDSRRLMVQMSSRVPVVGSLNLYLESYEPGEALTTVPAPALAGGEAAQ
ncbi:MAG TPA: DUF3108 domain-containing protein [Longimicrobiaceae bacterium]|nr:DUF3108 domain-containing protein [Longimicrobiaceae bacterium]